tara:strand:+ start:178638 stop:179816 length:1179 start_codon:yes stop_codon:yes gene_type:complete
MTIFSKLTAPPIDFDFDELNDIDVAYDEIVSLEAKLNGMMADLDVGQQISTEGFFSTWLKVALDTIYRLWDRILVMIDGIRVQAENRKVKANNLLNRIKKLPDLKKTAKVEYGSLSKWIMLDGKIPSPSELNKALLEMSKVLQFESNDVMVYLLRVAERIYPKAEEVFKIASDTKLKNEEKVSKLVPVFRSIADSGLLIRKNRTDRSGYSNTQQYDVPLAYVSEPLLGNSRVLVKMEIADSGAINETGNGLLNLVDKLYSTRVELDIDHDKYASNLEFVALNKQEQIKVIENCIVCLDKIIQFKVRHQGELNKSRAKFKSTRDRLINLSKEDDNVEFKLYCRKSAKALHATTRWMHSPSAALLVQSLRSCNAALEYCYRSQKEMINQNKNFS